MGSRSHWAKGNAESRRLQLGYGPARRLLKCTWFVSPQPEGQAELLQDHLNLAMHPTWHLLGGSQGASTTGKGTGDKATA